MNIKEMLDKLKSDKKTAIIVLVGILGIFLLAMSNFSSEKNINTNEDKVQSEETSSLTVDDIEEKLEKRLGEMISQISGAGNVKVMVTVASAGEYVYAQNEKKESDGNSSSADSEIVIYDSSNGDNALVVSIKSPDVLGVAVICEGGGSAVIKSEITKLVTSLFGIGSDRVYVGSKALK